MEHIAAVQELVDEQRAHLPTGVAVAINKECQLAYDALKGHSSMVFALVETTAGLIKRIDVPLEIVKRLSREWMKAGGFDALKKNKPNLVHVIDDHWISIPRSILRKHDTPTAKLVMVQMQFFRMAKTPMD